MTSGRSNMPPMKTYKHSENALVVQPLKSHLLVFALMKLHEGIRFIVEAMIQM